ncbi:protein TRANSPARENT TESTA 12-like [Dorcoceras hygrometricum]|uniref:Protein TRANSPARENT TESTA 12-like n=1 Tax=Dorcoceras hygrometricum TaxID=472368 RepID=A0A2Z7BIB0_9LAMI|nr:protein TRANSPARENT TESTA 12-like [Dorcoceras hygrometricum]
MLNNILTKFTLITTLIASIMSNFSVVTTSKEPAFGVTNLARILLRRWYYTFISLFLLEGLKGVPDSYHGFSADREVDLAGSAPEGG